MSFRDTQHLNTARGWSVYQDPVSSNEPAMIEPNNHNILQKVDNFPDIWNAKAGTAYINQNVALHAENGVLGQIDNNVLYTQQAVKLAPGQEVDIICIIDGKRRRQQGFRWHAVSLAVGCAVISVQALRTTLVVRIENITPNVLEVHKNIVQLSFVKVRRTRHVGGLPSGKNQHTYQTLRC